ncbi:MAG: glycosyltransferase family 2 protein [SAR324 cluster bacterium]
MKEPNIEFSIVMPCLNEAETLERCIVKAERSLARLKIAGEVVVADNGSTDGSIEIAQRLGARVIHVAERGYGNALREGMTQARGKYLIMGDADDSYDFSAIDPFVEKLRVGIDLVMGCRLPQGGGTILPGAMPWLHYRIGNPVLSFLGRFFFHNRITDYHCGLRGLSAEAFRRLNLVTTGMEFASEMVIKASLLHLNVDEIPITLHPAGRTRPAHLRTWRDGWRHLRFMLLYSPQWLFLFPGMAMFICGVCLMSLLLRGPFVIGNVRLDLNTMLIAMLMIVTGYQMILFAFMIRSYITIHHLVPEAKPARRTFAQRIMESGMRIGLLLFAISTLAIGLAILHWGQTGFGDLPPAIVRFIIPTITLFFMGIFTVISAFFFEMLSLKIRNV